MNRNVMWLTMIWLTAFTAAQAQKGAAAPALRIDKHPTKPCTIVITVANTEIKPLFFLRPDHPSLWYGWELGIAGPDGAYTFGCAPSIWVAGPESFILLKPGESFSTPLDLSDAISLNHREQKLGQTKGKFSVSLRYIFVGEKEMRERPLAIGEIIQLLTSQNFRYRHQEYGFLPPSVAPDLVMTNPQH